MMPTTIRPRIWPARISPSLSRAAGEHPDHRAKADQRQHHRANCLPDRVFGPVSKARGEVRSAARKKYSNGRHQNENEIAAYSQHITQCLPQRYLWLLLDGAVNLCAARGSGNRATEKASTRAIGTSTQNDQRQENTAATPPAIT